MSESSITKGDIERVIDASNRHGVFLHQAVVREFRKGGGKGFSVDGISVEHPISNARSGSADIMVKGRFQSPLGEIPVTFAVECKRAYGDKRKLFFFR